MEIRKQNGFAFSLDAMIAVLITITAVIAVANIGSISHNTPVELAGLQASAEDILTVLDKNGTLNELMPMATPTGDQLLATALDRLLPQNAEARMNLTVCTWNEPGFTCSKTFSAQTNDSAMEVKVAARRVVQNYSTNTFGIAILEVGFLSAAGLRGNGDVCTNSSQCASSYCGPNFPGTASYCCSSGFCCIGAPDCGGATPICANNHCTAVDSISVAPLSASLNTSQTLQFSATCYAESLPVSCAPAPAWSASGGIGSVSGSGLFTATNPGTGKINASIGTATGSADVAVFRPNGDECEGSGECASSFCGPNWKGDEYFCCDTSASGWCCQNNGDCKAPYKKCSDAPGYYCQEE